MAVEGIAGIVQNYTDQLFGQRPGTPARGASPGAGNAGNTSVTEDSFTPSSQNSPAQATAQDAGIFQLSLAALTTVTANIPFAQTTPNTNQDGTPAQAAPAPTMDAGTAQTDAAENSHPQVNAAQRVAATSAAQAATGAAVPNLQVQIQTLNAALPALGLTNAEIQQIDRIASVINDFNPAAFTNLVRQFEALAQKAAQQSTTIAPAIAGAVAIPNTTGGANTNGGGLQVKEIFIHITGLQEAVNNIAAIGGGQGSTANNIQTTAASLQIEQVQFTLADDNGKTVQVQATQENNITGTTDRQSSQTHVAVV